jgi:hypothetical protein
MLTVTVTPTDTSMACRLTVAKPGKLNDTP